MERVLPLGYVVSVEYEGSVHQLLFSSPTITVTALLKESAAVLKLPAVPDSLMFRPTPGNSELIPVRSDNLLRDILRCLQTSSPGQLVVPSYQPFLTVDQFMQTFLTAVLDTTVARRELASVFLAVSCAWERAVRENGWRRRRTRVAQHRPNHAYPERIPEKISSVRTACQDEAESGCTSVRKKAETDKSFAIQDAPTAKSVPSHRDSIPDAAPKTMYAGEGKSSLFAVMFHLVKTHTATQDSRQGDAIARAGTPPPMRFQPHESTEAVSSEAESMSRPESPRSATSDGGVPSALRTGRAKIREYMQYCTDSRSDMNAEQRALACFCTHYGYSCAGCDLKPIEGSRYECKTCSSYMAVSLCSSCRRSGVHLTDDCRLFVYDHPWEADQEYIAAANDRSSRDLLKVPRAPLSLGDTGPRVVHLHYVLYKMGYLDLRNKSLTIGVYCNETQRSIYRFQEDHQLVCESSPSSAAALAVPSLSLSNSHHASTAKDEAGVFTLLTRRTILNLFREVESSISRVRCGPRANTGGTGLQSLVAA